MGMTIDVILEFLKKTNKKMAGYYNDNYILNYNEKKYLLRIPIENAVLMDIKAFQECDILKALEKLQKKAPRLLYDFYENGQAYYIHQFIEGKTIEETFPEDSMMDNWIVKNIAFQIADIHQIKENDITIPYKKLWDNNVKSLYDYIFSFNKSLVEKYYYNNRELYKKLEFPDNFENVFEYNGNKLYDEEFCFCHTDIHRKNVLVDYKNKECNIIDWELSNIASPAYDISINMHKMRYNADQEKLFIKSYCDRTGYNYEKFANQVDVFRALEEIKSAGIDIIRYLEEVENSRVNYDEMKVLADRYCKKLNKARKRWNMNSIDENIVFEIFENKFNK